MRDLCRQVADPAGVLTGLGVAELGEDRQLFERLEMLSRHRAGTLDRRAVAPLHDFEVVAAESEDLGFLTGGSGFVRHLQGAESQIGGVGEHLPVLVVVGLATLERLLEPAAALERRGEQVVDLELVLLRVGALRHVEGGLEHGDRVVEGAAPKCHPPFRHHHAQLRRIRGLGAVFGHLLEHLAGLGETLRRLVVVGQAHVRLGQIGEQVGDDRRAVFAGDLDRSSAHRHRRQVLRS